MKVILLRDVAKIGRRHTVVEVPDGYAQNQLIPKKWAEPATPVNLKKLKQNQSVKEVLHSNDEHRFAAAVEAMAAAPLQISGGAANEQGHLFKAVREEDIVHAAKNAGIGLDKSEVVIELPIKSLGAHTITLKRGGKKVSCTVEVIK
ncbi:MAG TPA: 50S ribosomal protein L9 [Candidatus Paceibacterota bacterium]